MHVAILGAGAVARVYAVKLATRRAARVTLVVRPTRAADAAPIRIEQVDGARDVETWSAPVLATRVPEDADVVVVTVRAEQLDASIDALLGSPAVPIVVLTPMMPGDASRLGLLYGARLCAAMVGVVAYVNDAGACRYWLPMGVTTLLDELEPPAPATFELAAALVACGVRARVERDVQASNLATTVAIVPAAMGIDAAGSIGALLDDRALSTLALAAVKEGIALSGRLGKGAAWMGYLTPFVGKTMVRIGASLGQSRAPEAYAYVESHFGRKLHAQNVAMGREVVALAQRTGVPCPAMEELLGRLNRPASS
jgi:2-dehydropantoate 2-reductase